MPAICPKTLLKVEIDESDGEKECVQCDDFKDDACRYNRPSQKVAQWRNLHIEGLANWEADYADLKELCNSFHCFVCTYYNCLQWQPRRKASDQAKKDCPLADHPRLCKLMSKIPSRLARCRDEMKYLIRDIRQAHKKAGVTS